jgi:CheY-like chemotaxis protein
MDIKVLLADDDPVLCKIYLQAFAAANIPCSVVNNGRDVVEKSVSEKPSIILLDIMMANIDGLEILDNLKNDARVKDIPVIMFSNLTKPQLFDTVKQHGGVECIDKSRYLPREIVQKTVEIQNRYYPT